MAERHQNDDRETIAAPDGRVPVIGVGGSAGALESLAEFFEALPADIGAAVAVVTHLDPHHESSMAEIIGKHTAMPVAAAEDGIPVQPNHVYVIPPGVELRIREGTLRLTEMPSARRIRMPVDHLFRSLAEDPEQRTACIVLSGTGTDGTLGLRAVKEQGGLTLVQDPKEAAYDGMPRSAVDAAAVDLVLPVGDMPRAIADYLRHLRPAAATATPAEGERLEDVIGTMVELLAAKTPHDFRSYKRGTLLRRTERRMAVRHIRSPRAYRDLLRNDDSEVGQLVKDLLINFTSFFRDPVAFEALADDVLPEMLKGVEAGKDLRVWVPGCSTGEEPYSLVMLLVEQMAKHGVNRRITVFATDVDEEALAFARAGVYPDAIAADVSPVRLERFFAREQHAFRVARDIREMVVFAAHNLLTDAPFSKLDLISCRNVLIYLLPEVQEKALDLFHFALEGRGVLFLGPSETVTPKRDRFEDISRKHHIYRCIGPSRRHPAIFPLVRGRGVATPKRLREPRRNRVFEVARDVLLDTAIPASVVINQQHDALCFFGPTDRYLRVPSGEASQDLLKMARQGLRPKLRLAVQKAFDPDQAPAIETVTLERRGDAVRVTIRARPFPFQSETLVLVSFSEEPAAPWSAPARGAGEPRDADVTEQLERALAATRSELEETIRELENANEDLRVANEEAMSMNEELQSTNEELETSKEELQSVNEELITVNSQLQQKAEENRQTANDLNNLLVSSDIATVFLDDELRIKRFTPATSRLFSLIPGDAGRPLADLAQRFEDPELLDDAREVLASHAPRKREIRSQTGSWYSRQIRPYRTESDTVEGVVLTFVDITDLKTAQLLEEAGRRYTQGIVDTVREALVIVDESLRVVSVSPPFLELFRVGDDAAVGRPLDEVVGAALDASILPGLLKPIIKEGTPVEAFETELRHPDAAPVAVSILARPIVRQPADRKLVMLAIENISERRRAAAALRTSEERYRKQFEELETLYRTAPIGLALIDRDLRYVRVNEMLAEINGVPAEQHLGRTVFEMVPDIAEEVAALFRRVFDSGEPLENMEIIGETAKAPGEQRVYREDVYPVRDDKGVVFSVGVIVKEITERKRHEAELQQAMAAAERANRIKSDFLAAASHDIRQPLQTLSLLQEILAKKIHDEDLQRLVARLGATIGGMTETLNTLLDIDQLESGTLQPQVADFPIGDLLRRLRDEFLYQALGKGLEFHVIPTSAVIRTDPHLFVRALQNLVANAIKYTASGKIVLGCRHRGPMLRIEIWDSGVGIPADQLHGIFERYARVETATRGHKRGLGLGLSVVRHVMDLLGHEFEVRSVVGRGSMFAIIAPRVAAGVLPTVSRPGPARGREAKRSILLIEDEETMLGSLTTLLELEGFAVTPVESGERGLELLEMGTVRPDVILIDSNLGEDLAGIDLMERMRRAAGRHLPTIVMSGEASRHVAERVTAAGLFYVQKPVRTEQLVSMVNQAMERAPTPGGAAHRAEMRTKEKAPHAESEFVTARSADQAPPTDTDAVVYIVDDDDAILAAWTRILKEEGYAVQAFASAEDFLDGRRIDSHGCLVTDFALPGINGLELQQRLRDAGSLLPVILATGRHELGIAAQATRGGATDVLEKPVAGDDLVAAIRRALQSARERSRHDSERAMIGHRWSRLTPRERQVMELVVAGHANKEVAYRLGISQRTVENHRARVMEKMKVPSLADLVRAAAVVGIGPASPCGPEDKD